MKTKPVTLMLPILLFTIEFQANANDALNKKAIAEIRQFERRFSSALARNDMGELQIYLSDDCKRVRNRNGQ
jgi:hypothetical protein